MIKNYLFFVLLSLFSFSVTAQDDLMSLLEDDGENTETKFVSATFKSTRLVNGHTTEVRPGGVLEFVISHRFGKLNDGVGQLFGLDDAQVRFALEYGLNDKVNIGFGRSSIGKVLDGFVKYKILKQSTGMKTMPISLAAFTSTAIATGPNVFSDASQDNKFSQRVSYTYQLLLARKFNSNLSLQLMPSLVHRNVVITTSDPNDVLSIGFGGRHKLTNRLALNAEYYLNLTEQGELYKNSFSIGFDIETGGHVFQLHLTNSRAMIERGFITDTTGSWGDGDIHFGFNVSRVFNVKNKK
ncbi:MAG: hypothetical protein ACJA2S_005400 [Cyclobacteriaceae bacterium]|jgi:hypothetical protein